MCKNLNCTDVSQANLKLNVSYSQQALANFSVQCEACGQILHENVSFLFASTISLTKACIHLKNVYLETIFKWGLWSILTHFVLHAPWFRQLSSTVSVIKPNSQSKVYGQHSNEKGEKYISHWLFYPASKGNLTSDVMRMFHTILFCGLTSCASRFHVHTYWHIINIILNTPVHYR